MIQSQENSQPSRFDWLRKIPWGAVRIAVGIIAVAFIMLTMNWPAFFIALQSVNPLFVGLALGINFVTLALSALRWQILLRSDGVEVSLLTLARYYLISLFFNNYLPPFVGADAVRMLTIKESKSPGVRVVSVLIERGSGMFMLLLFGALALAANPTLRTYFSLDAVVLLGLAGIAAALLALLLPELWLWAVKVTERIPKLSALLLDIAEAGKRYRKRRRTLALTFLISGLIQLLVVLAFQFRALAFHADVTLWQTLLIAPTITLLTLIPLSPGGLGTQEGFFALTYGAILISPATALAMALLARVLDMTMGVIGAIVWLRNR